MSSDSQALFAAINTGSDETALALLNKNPNLASFRDEKNRTPLHLAVIHKRTNLLPDLLIKCKITFSKLVDFTDNEGKAPLHYAGTAPIVNALLLVGANVNARDYNHDTPLHLAVNAQVVSALINNNADLNLQNSNCHTPLYKAVLAGRAGVVEALLAAGADASIGSFSYTPEELALDLEYPIIYELFAKYTKEDDEDDLGDTSGDEDDLSDIAGDKDDYLKASDDDDDLGDTSGDITSDSHYSADLSDNHDDGSDRDSLSGFSNFDPNEYLLL